MRAILFSIFGLLLVSGCASQGRAPERVLEMPPSTQAPVLQTERVPQTLEEALNAEQIDLPRALLLFSERYYPEFSGRPHDADIPAKLVRFKAYSDELQRDLNRARTSSQRIRALTDFVHIRLGLRFDPADEGGSSPENLFFDRVLQSRYGYCVSLSLAYLVFGRVAGMDIAAIRIPGHFAVVVREPGLDGLPAETIIETTDFGATRDDLYYFARYRFSTTSVQNGVYLTPISDREIFGTLYNNLAGLTFMRGDHRLAIERYTRALELAPKNAEAMYNRAVALRKQKRAQEGLRDLNEALRLDPNFVLALMLRAGLLWENGEKTKAREDLAEATRKRPDWIEPLMLEAELLFQDRQLDESRRVYERVLEMRPSHKSALIGLAQVETAAGNFDKARRHMRDAEAQ